MAGPTYCSRLWCVMEARRPFSKPSASLLALTLSLSFPQIFTFLFMGGKLDRIEIHALSASEAAQASSTDTRHGLDSLKEQFANFDAAQAQCFLPEDKHRLLAVVEAGFGDFKEFNRRVRTAFAERLDATPLRHRSSIFWRQSTVKATRASAGQRGAGFGQGGGSE